MTIQQAFQIALQQHQSGRFVEAETLYRQILVVEPGNADAFHLLGMIALQSGRNDVAVDLIRQAIALKPDYPEALSNLGLALKNQGRLDEAIAVYRQAIALQPQLAEARCNLGIALYDHGQADAAIAAYREAIALRPNYAEAHSNLGNALKESGRLDEAIAEFRQALAIKPDYPEGHYNLGVALYDKGHLDESIAECRQAIALEPRLAEAHCNLGIALRDQGRLEEAIAACEQAIALQPRLAEAHYNLGIAREDQGRRDEALAAFRQAIALNPDDPRARFAVALALLVQGDFAQGWPEFEWRWKLPDVEFANRNFTQPLWNGEPLEGRTLLIHAEQGLGDTLQFVRYAPMAAQLGGRVVLECQPGLETLLAGVERISQVIIRGEALPPFDCHCPIMSLPLAFRTRVETIPADIPYLRADPQKADRWRERLERATSAAGESGAGRRDPLKVGLVWAGGSRLHHPQANRIDRRRSISLSQLTPLTGVPGVVFVSLQKGGPADQARTPPAGMRLLDWSAELEDFADTAALVEALDLVISVDTAVAHLAGAMGKPVWVLNRFDTCWRWLLGRSDSPWYPTMRLFRQPRFADWPPVIAEVREHLQLLVQSRE